MKLYTRKWRGRGVRMSDENLMSSGSLEKIVCVDRNDRRQNLDCKGMKVYPVEDDWPAYTYAYVIPVGRRVDQ